MKQNAFYELLNEIITHINKDFQYNYNELESYLLQKHPEWHVFSMILMRVIHFLNFLNQMVRVSEKR